MYLEDYDDDRRKAAIKLLENSLFDRPILGVQHAIGIADTLPGFTARLSRGVPYYTVQINSKLL